MKRLAVSMLALIVVLTSCSKKDDNPTQEQNGFHATINNQSYTFKILSATLFRFAPSQQKRMDITAVSEDGSKRITLTLGEETDQGNGIAVKAYVLNPFPDDNPNTENIDESASAEGFTTYSTSLGNNSWITRVYDENGKFIVSACDAANTVISATFETTLVNLNDNADVVKITNGKISNVTYKLLN